MSPSGNENFDVSSLCILISHHHYYYPLQFLGKTNYKRQKSVLFPTRNKHLKLLACMPSLLFILKVETKPLQLILYVRYDIYGFVAKIE